LGETLYKEQVTELSHGVKLNPLLWYLDSDNPDIRDISIDELRRILKERHGLDESAIRYLIDCDMNYGDWQQSGMMLH